MHPSDEPSNPYDTQEEVLRTGWLSASGRAVSPCCDGNDGRIYLVRVLGAECSQCGRLYVGEMDKNQKRIQYTSRTETEVEVKYDGGFSVQKIWGDGYGEYASAVDKIVDIPDGYRFIDVGDIRLIEDMCRKADVPLFAYVELLDETTILGYYGPRSVIMELEHLEIREGD